MATDNTQAPIVTSQDLDTNYNHRSKNITQSSEDIIDTYFYIQGVPVPDAKLFVKESGVVVYSNGDTYFAERGCYRNKATRKCFKKI